MTKVLDAIPKLSFAYGSARGKMGAHEELSQQVEAVPDGDLPVAKIPGLRKVHPDLIFQKRIYDRRPILRRLRP